MKEYIVVAKTEADIDSVHNDLTRDTTQDANVNHSTIPTRNVSVANARLGNPRITHYMLTDAEAEALGNDPRLEAVHLPPPPDTKIRTAIQRSVAYDGTAANFSRNTKVDKFNVNWGLRRTSIPVTETKIGNTYDYDVDGAGVDFVLMDDGIQADHPEFLDASGVSRVQQINWYAVTGIPGTMPANHYKIQNYGDGEHGTHVAGIVAGKTFGYAKNARIYLIRIFGNYTQVIPDADQFDLIRVWHNNKPINPATGMRRPTIVNMSWGYAWYYSNSPWSDSGIIRSVNYRGRTYQYYSNPVRPQLQFGQRPESGARHCFNVPSVDAEVRDAENAGIIFVHSAGNYGHKIDKPNGVDYNNYYTTYTWWAGFIPPGNPIYYHRGGSPTSPNCITVSAAASTTRRAGQNVYELVDYYSERGPGCDVVASGSDITSSTSKQSSYTTSEYVWGRNTNPFTSHKVTKISGTSMAAPQVTGVLALYLSRNPGATPAQAKAWIASLGSKNQIYSTTANNDWSNRNALLGGSNNYLYNPYHNQYKDR